MKDFFTRVLNVIKNNKNDALEIAIYLITIISVLIGFSGLTENVVDKHTQALDLQISKIIYSLRVTDLTIFFKIMSFIGSAIGIMIVLALLTVYLYRMKLWNQLALIVVAVSGSAFLNVVMKALFHRVRPTISPLAVEISYSYPSGHSMTSIAFYLGLVYLYWNITKKKISSIIALIIALILISLIGFSRIYLGVHYTTDVVGGFLGGFIWLLITISLYKGYFLYKKIKKKS